MNKFYRSLLWTGIAAAGLAGCGDDVTIADPPPPPPPAIRSVTVTPDGVNVSPGQTITMTANVVADAGATVSAPTWSVSPATAGTISAAGVLTIAANAPDGPIAVRAQVTATPGGAQGAGSATLNVVGAKVTGISVNPTSVVLAADPAAKASATASVSGTGNFDPGVNWSLATTGIVTLSATTGNTIEIIPVAGVSGTTQVIATAAGDPTKTASISVQVIPASVTIEKITQGGLSNPVQLNNVSGQIEISLNVDPGAAANISKVQAVMGGVVVAEQVFGAGAAAKAAAPQAAQQSITQSLDTRQVKKVNGQYVPVVFNGPNNVSARIFLSNTSTPIVSNAIPVVLRNQDAWTSGTALVLEPTSTSPSFTNLAGTWYKSDVKFSGGPNYISFFPVQPTIMVSSNNCGQSGDAAQGSPQTGITLSGTFPCQTDAFVFEAGVDANGLNVTPGTAPAADVKYVAADTEEIEVVGTPYMVDGNQRFSLLDGGSIDFGNEVLVDLQGPSISADPIGHLSGGVAGGDVAPNNCEETLSNPGCWVGASYDLTQDFPSTDNGTGVAQIDVRDWVTNVPSVTCGTVNYNSGANLTEDPSPSKYHACAFATDNIGNVSVNVEGFNVFGADKTPPTIAYSGTYVSDSASLAAVGAGNIDYTVNDNNSGLDDGALTLHLKTLLADAPALCYVGSVTGVVSTTDITGTLAAAPAGTPRTMAAPIAAADNGCGDQGYYTWTGTVSDRAGNTADDNTPVVAAVDRDAPAIQAVGPQPLYKSGQNATVLVFATDSTDLAGVRLDVRYTATGGTAVDLRYTITSGFGLAWDDLLTTITTPATGFPATIPGAQVFGSFVIDTTVALGGVGAALTQIQTTAFDFNSTTPNLSATVVTPLPNVYKDAAFFPAAGWANPWASTGIFSGSPGFSGAAVACTYTYDTPTNGPTIPTSILVANQIAAGPPVLLEILFAITTTGNGLGANDNPKLISDNGTQRRYQYSISATDCPTLQGAGTLRLIAVKSGVSAQTVDDAVGLPSAYLVP
jgi:hypothetical protein